MSELKKVRSKCGSLDNIHHKPGGGDVKIYSRPVDFDRLAESKVDSRNEGYVRQGGDVKIFSEKMNFKRARSRVGSLENINYTPHGGDKKIFNQPVVYK